MTDKLIDKVKTYKDPVSMQTFISFAVPYNADVDVIRKLLSGLKKEDCIPRLTGYTIPRLLDHIIKLQEKEKGLQ